MEKRKPTGYVALPASDYSQLDTSEADPLSRPSEITALQPLPPANHDDLDDDRNRTFHGISSLMLHVWYSSYIIIVYTWI